MGLRAVVAGGAGFLGYHFVNLLLSRDYEVLIVDNLSTGSRANVAECLEPGQCDFLAHDVCEPVTIPGRVDVVANLACPASPDDFARMPLEIMRVCSEGTRNLLDLALCKQARFLQASTSEVYGDPEVHPQREDYHGNVSTTGPRSVYDEGKRYAEALCMAFHRQYALPVRIVRIFNTYGPRMRPDDGRVVSNFCVQALTGQPLTIYGGGGQSRSFCYCEDEVDGFLRLLESSETGPVNIGNPEETTVRELAELIIEMTGSRSPLRNVPPLHPDDPQRRRPDITLAREALGWEPRTSLRDGLSRTIEWFREAVQRGAIPQPALA
jgi:nucleoside-diphosphate-sugar epimerase